jgi:hypothetical protein
MLFRDIFAVTSELGLPVAEMQIWALSAWVAKSKKNKYPGSLGLRRYV